MTQTAITLAFEAHLAEQQLGGQPVVLDEMVLAHIPGLDLSQPIDRAAGLPDASRIVHRQPVDQRGKINANGVAYSIVMDTNLGDFTFNAMYLTHKASGLVAMVVHKAEEDKLKNLLNRPGNSLVKSMLMEYQGAAEATLTHVDAGTWQIDFTARLMGLDKDIQQQAHDHYGDAAFIADGFAVRPGTGVNEFLVTPGLGYIAGLRTELNNVQSVTVAQRPAVLYADVYHAGTLLSDWHTLVTIRASSTPLSDYVDEAGYPHYVTPLASLATNGAVTDLRGRGGLWWHEHRPDAHTKDQVGLDKLENWSWSHSYTDATGGATKYASGKAVADAYNKLNSIKLNAASYTAADVLAKLLTVDGAGSGLDTDLLDGKHGVYYLDWRNFTHTPDFALQQDVLDSYAQSYTLRPAAHVGYTGESASGRFAHLRGGTGNAGRTFAQALAEAASLGVRLPTVEELEDKIAAGTGAGFDSSQCWTCTAVPGQPGCVYTVRGDGASGTRKVVQTNSVATADCRYVANVTVPHIWHAANDGAGSGLDADSVDGIQGNDIARRSQGNTFAGSIQVLNGTKSFFISTAGIERGFFEGGTYGIRLRSRDANGNSTPATITLSNTPNIDLDAETIRAYGRIAFRLHDDWLRINQDGNFLNGVYFANSTVRTENDFQIGNNGTSFLVSKTAFTYKGHKVWHAGNDGSGSGLDADTVDGLHAHQLIRAGVAGQTVGTDFQVRGAKFYFGSDIKEHNLFDNDGAGNAGIQFGMNIDRHTVSGGAVEFQANIDNTTNPGFEINVSTGNKNAGDVVSWACQLIGKSDGSLTWNNHSLWHAGNDGSGSGMDADLLDGKHGAYYLDWRNFTHVPKLGSQLIAEVRSSTKEAYSGDGSWAPKESGYLKRDFTPEAGATYQITAKICMGYATSTEGLRDIDFYTWLTANGVTLDMTTEDLLSSQGEGRTLNLTYTGPITPAADGVARIRVGFKCGGGDNPGSLSELKVWGLNVTDPHVWNSIQAGNRTNTKSVLTIVKL
ncbi:phage tail-collar fiber domain-containing protein [Oceanimonas smirnovii]|uniref:phage tail-collar fiber domain-containing protein n=1 Tax=Oceanimonas smirnovii TaxID=264574 RepID=UPI003FD12808